MLDIIIFFKTFQKSAYIFSKAPSHSFFASSEARLKSSCNYHLIFNQWRNYLSSPFIFQVLIFF